MTSTIVPTPPVEQRKLPLNAPKFSMLAAALLIALAITAIVIGSITHADISPIMGFVALAIPALLSSAFAERNNNDLRNGVVQEKATQGALSALHSTGMVQAAATTLENRGATSLAMEALARLLELNTNATQTNTAGQQTVVDQVVEPIVKAVEPVIVHAVEPVVSAVDPIIKALGPLAGLIAGSVAQPQAPLVPSPTPQVGTPVASNPLVESAGGKTNG